MKKLGALLMSFTVIGALGGTLNVRAFAADFVRGIDVSSYQKDIDWSAVRNSGIEFAIIRSGTTNFNSNDLWEDSYFEINYDGASSNGIQIGTYYFTSAYTLDGFRQNAYDCLSYLNGRHLDYPIFIDVEQESRSTKQVALGKQTLTDYLLDALGILRAAGYQAGIYSSKSFLNDYLFTDQIEANGYTIWMAQYPSGSYAVDPANYDKSSQCSLWQYSDKGDIDGVNGGCDVDVAYNTPPVLTDEPYAPYPRPTGNVKKGMKGSYVGWVQYTLHEWLGYDIGSYGVDCDFGSGTDAAVRAFQGDHGLDVDGIVGNDTRNAIIAEIDKLQYPSKPELTVSAGSQYTPVTLTWNHCENTNLYGVRVFKSDGTQVKYIEPYYDTSYTISLTAGDYYANIAAVNDHGYTFSDNIPFTVSSGTVTPIASAVLNGHLYSVYDTEMWYTHCEAIAKQFGGHLVTITSQEENDFITALIKDGKHSAYRIGGTDTAQEGTFRWSDGEEMSYTNWAQNQPDDAGSNEDYMEISKTGLWNDTYDEATTRGFVLEIEPLTPAASAACQNNKYQIFDASMTWTDARTYCEMLGGHLAYISSAEEEEAVYALTQQGKSAAYWLGASRGKDGFAWLDKTALTYQNWRESQPDNWENVENYLELVPSTGYWNDNRNTACRGFVCEFENANALDIPETLTLQTGEVYTVKTNGRTLTFKSHQPKIAAVSESGVISAKAVGTAVISVVDEDANVTQITVSVVPASLSGDCNADGKADRKDVQLLQRWLLGDTKTTISDWRAADLNGDGQLNAIDLSMLKMLLLNEQA